MSLGLIWAPAVPGLQCSYVTMSKLALSIITTVMTIAFQNCSREIIIFTNSSNVAHNAMDPDKVSVGNSVWPRTDSDVLNRAPLSVTKAALPLAIDFVANPALSSSGAGVAWGFWIHDWKEIAPQYTSYLGQPKYLFRLDLFKGAVVELASHEAVYQLSREEMQTLKNILDESILASAQQFAATSACTPSAVAEYATLETDYGMFDLGAGNPCAVVDLFRNDNSGISSGLEGLLNQIQSKLGTVSL